MQLNDTDQGHERKSGVASFGVTAVALFCVGVGRVTVYDSKCLRIINLHYFINNNLFSLRLFTAPNGFTGLLIRSEVLCGLGQFQSSLADAENALRSRPTSAQVCTQFVVVDHKGTE